MATRRRRPRKPTQGQLEDELLSKARWSGLRQQQELEALNHSERENCESRRRTKELLEGGWGSIDWIDLYGQK